jgi:hypothetical protein
MLAKLCLRACVCVFLVLVQYPWFVYVYHTSNVMYTGFQWLTYSWISLEHHSRVKTKGISILGIDVTIICYNGYDKVWPIKFVGLYPICAVKKTFNSILFDFILTLLFEKRISGEI